MRQRHAHDLSNYSWSSCKAGELIPLKVTEVLPNDTFKIRSEAVIRLDALNAPTMHPLKVKIFHFYQPNRQAWPGWNDFITQGYDGAQSPTFPTITLNDATGAVSTQAHRMIGSWVATGNTEVVNAIPFHMYINVYDKYFRDPNVDAPIDFELTDGDNTANWVATAGAGAPFNVAWRKDYFNTARVEPELGGAVPIPQSNVVSSGTAPVFRNLTGGAEDRKLRSTAGSNAATYSANYTSSSDLAFSPAANSTGLEMDETAVMRDLSIAGALQIFRENRQDWGSRIIDYLRKGFGSKISSYELAEPVLLNYGEKTIRFSEVLQTAEAGSDPVGTLRGHGIGGLGTNTAHYTVPEHGYIMTLAYIMPEPAYLNAAERHWFKNAFTDFYQQEFEDVGYQEVYDKEIGFGFSANTGVFGYQKRYDEYRRSLNTISGTFSTTDKDWHMARDFAGVLPNVNGAFIRGAPTQRIFADTSGEVYKIMAYHEMVARRNIKRDSRRRIL